MMELKLLRASKTKTTLSHAHKHLRGPMKHCLTLLFLLCISGCIATKSGSIFDVAGSKPIIDTKGIDISQYELDLEECETFADEISTVKSIVKGTATGAAGGTVIEAVTDGSRRTKDATELGAIASGGKSGIRAVQEKEQIVKRCVRGRGYQVLN